MTPNWDMRTGSSTNTHGALAGAADSQMGSERQQKITLSLDKQLRHGPKTLESALRFRLQQVLCLTTGKSPEPFFAWNSHLENEYSGPRLRLRGCWDPTGMQYPEIDKTWTGEPEQKNLYVQRKISCRGRKSRIKKFKLCLWSCSKTQIWHCVCTHATCTKATQDHFHFVIAAVV